MQNTIVKPVSLVHRFQPAVAEGKRYVLKEKYWRSAPMAKLDNILFSRELCIVHDCWVYELLSFDVILCKNQFIRAEISFQCLHMISQQYYHM